VGLVEDDGVVLGQHAPACREVGEVERVVADHELGLARASPRGLGEAGAVERAAAPGAAVGADGELRPERIRRLDRQLGPVAGLRPGEPGLERLERLLVARVAEEHRPEALQLLAADVVLASLQDRHAYLAPERARRGGHLLRQELLLERLRRGRDDDALTRLERRDQVREALPRPGAGLREEVLARRERMLDRDGERGLLGPRLVGGERGGERAARPEDVLHGRKPTRANGCSPRTRRTSRRLTSKTPLRAGFPPNGR
jgi:hypothetical protein